MKETVWSHVLEGISLLLYAIFSVTYLDSTAARKQRRIIDNTDMLIMELFHSLQSFTLTVKWHLPLWHSLGKSLFQKFILTHTLLNCFFPFLHYLGVSWAELMEGCPSSPMTQISRLHNGMGYTLSVQNVFDVAEGALHRVDLARRCTLVNFL